MQVFLSVPSPNYCTGCVTNGLTSRCLRRPRLRMQGVVEPWTAVGAASDVACLATNELGDKATRKTKMDKKRHNKHVSETYTWMQHNTMRRVKASLVFWCLPRIVTEGFKEKFMSCFCYTIAWQKQCFTCRFNFDGDGVNVSLKRKENELNRRSLSWLHTLCK